MIKWIISGVLSAFTIAFAFLKSVWTGFIYLGIISLAFLCLYWIYQLIKQYKKDYHTNFEKAFVAYKADYINYYNLSSEEFENNLQLHLANFKKQLKKEKFVDIFKILFVLSFFVACIIAMLTL